MSRPPDVLRRTRLPSRHRLTLALGLGALAVASCDTGDGKTLQPPDESATTVAPTPTLASVPLETVELVTSANAGGEGSAVDTTISVSVAPSPFQVFAPWQDGGPIDTRNTCDGEDVSPAVSWASPPDGTTELAVALVDESATAGDGPFVHWVLVGVDPDDISVFEGDVPVGAVQAVNSFGTIGYGGPCPPEGDAAHTYRLTLYALNQQNELADGTTATELLDFVEDVAIGAADLTGTYRR